MNLLKGNAIHHKINFFSKKIFSLNFNFFFRKAEITAQLILYRSQRLESVKKRKLNRHKKLQQNILKMFVIQIKELSLFNDLLIPIPLQPNVVNL